jgi:hypothetical protein
LIFLRLLNSSNFHFFHFFSDDDKPKEATTVVPPLTTSIALKKRPQEDTMVDKPPQDLQEKFVGAQAIKRRKKTAHTAIVSLEAHRSSSSSDHVSTILCTLTLCF